MAGNEDGMDDDGMDGAVFSRLVLQTERQMRTLVLALIPGCRDVDDIVQESCSVMWDKIDQYDSGRPFAPWALAFVRMQTMAYLTRRKRDRLQLSGNVLDSIYESAVSDASDNLESERIDALEDCMSALSQQERSLLTRRYVDGQTVKDLSERDDGIGKSQEALYKIFARLQTRLLRCIEGKLNS